MAATTLALCRGNCRRGRCGDAARPDISLAMVAAVEPAVASQVEEVSLLAGRAAGARMRTHFDMSIGVRPPRCVRGQSVRLRGVRTVVNQGTVRERGCLASPPLGLL